MRWCGALALIAVTLGCAASPSPPAVGMTAALHEFAGRVGARYVAGPRRGSSGTYAAVSVVRSISAVRRTRNRMLVLRWDDGKWATVATLVPEHDPVTRGTRYAEKFWNFPDFGLRALSIAGAAETAPVFMGPVNGTYPVAAMVAVRSATGSWAWRDFVSCEPASCDSRTSRDDTIRNPRVRHKGRLVSVVTPCAVCHGSTARTRWTWVSARSDFEPSRDL